MPLKQSSLDAQSKMHVCQCGKLLPHDLYGRKEYMRFPINLILDEIMDKNNLHTIVHKDHVYAEIIHGMYGLPQVD